VTGLERLVKSFSGDAAEEFFSPSRHSILAWTSRSTMAQSSSLDTLICDHGHRRRVIVQSLLMDVFQGRLRAGQHLVTQELAQRFGVSHTPIREAMIALEGIGIIDVMPNRGAIIRRVGFEKVKEICQVRRVLECEATRGACGWIAPADLRALASDFRGLLTRATTPSAEFFDVARDADSRLHDLIAASCRNGFLKDELGRLKVLFRAFRDVTYVRDEARFSSGRFEAEAREHLAIVESLLNDDRKAAVRAMSRHIRKSVENWSGALPETSEGEPSIAGREPETGDRGNPPKNR
jgi:DNA-binding GntR family transcriptional regulator